MSRRNWLTTVETPSGHRAFKLKSEAVLKVLLGGIRASKVQIA